MKISFRSIAFSFALGSALLSGATTLKNPTVKQVFSIAQMSGTNTQDMVIHGDTAICFGDALKQVYLVSLSQQKFLGTLSTTATTGVHCNTVSFGPKYTSTDKLPLIYVTQASNKHATNVYWVSDNRLSLIQTITFNGYKNTLTCFDSASKDSMYVIAWNGPADRTPNIFKIATPATTVSTVDLTKLNDYFSIYYVNSYEVIQGVTIKDGMMYQTRGYKKGGQLAVIDLKEKKPVQLINLVNNGFNYEPEGIDFQGDKLWICDQPGNFFEVQEQEPLKPTETKAVRTLSFPDGWRQSYALNNNEGYWSKDSCNGYQKTWTAATQDLAYTFTMDSVNHYGSMNDWSFVRVGRAGAASKAFITTDQPVSEAIASVVVNVQKFLEPDKVKDIYLDVASNPDFTDRQRIMLDKTAYVPGYMVFNVLTPKANQYYRLVFDLNAVKANGSIQFSRVSFYARPFSAVSIKNTQEKPYTVSEACKRYDEGEGLLDTVYVSGKVISAEATTYTGKGTTTTTRATALISDDGSSASTTIKVYDSALWKKEGNYTDDLRNEYLAAGREVVFYGTLAKWHNTYELGTGGWLVSSNKATGIASVVNRPGLSAAVYNIQGQKVAESLDKVPAPGLYISEGKKYAVK